MTRLQITTGMWLVSLLLLGTVEPASAKTIKYQERSFGTFHNTAIDTNGDTIPATLSLLTGHTTAGRMTGETLGEFRPLDPTLDTPSGECAAGTLEFTFVNGVGVNRFWGWQYFGARADLFRALFEPFDWLRHLYQPRRISKPRQH